jgi:hypothetical protein
VFDIFAAVIFPLLSFTHTQTLFPLYSARTHNLKGERTIFSRRKGREIKRGPLVTADDITSSFLFILFTSLPALNYTTEMQHQAAVIHFALEVQHIKTKSC